MERGRPDANPQTLTLARSHVQLEAAGAAGLEKLARRALPTTRALSLEEQWGASRLIDTGPSPT